MFRLHPSLADTRRERRNIVDTVLTDDHWAGLLLSPSAAAALARLLHRFLPLVVRHCVPHLYRSIECLTLLNTKEEVRMVVVKCVAACAFNPGVEISLGLGENKFLGVAAVR